MTSQLEKGRAFRALHERDGAFIIPNPWDVGTARLLAHLGFEALATTGAGHAFSRGQRDGTLGRDGMMQHVEEIASATELPVSADLENGFGDDPERIAETIRMGAERGLVGASIEDFRYGGNDGLYEPSLAKERIQAAAEAVASLPFPFLLTARCENYLAAERWYLDAGPAREFQPVHAGHLDIGYEDIEGAVGDVGQCFEAVVYRQYVVPHALQCVHQEVAH